MESAHESFAVLMPICVKVAKEPTKENACELREVIRRVSCQGSSLEVDALQAYILFPLELHLKSGKTRFETRRYLLDCMWEVIHHMHIISLGKLLDLYTLVFIQIFDKERPGFVADVSEELKCSVLNCAIELLKNASQEITLELYDRANFRKLTQSIFMCVHLTHAERSRAVRLGAIGCIMALAQVHDEADTLNMVVRQRVGDTFMFVLPGIMHGLMQAITADDKQGHKVTMMALRAWSRIITIVMEDGETTGDDHRIQLNFSLNQQTEKEDHTNPLDKNWLLQDPGGTLAHTNDRARTPEWIRAAAEKLAPQASNLSALRNHPHWLVRQELVSTCNLLLYRCSRNLQPCVIQLLEFVIMLSEDETEKVAKSSKKCIDSFSAKCDSESNKLLEILEENFFSLVTKLPRVVHATNDGEQLTALRLLAGYLRLLGSSKLPGVLSSASHLHRLTMTLVHIVELDNSGVSLLDEYSLRDLTSDQITGLSSPWKQFKYFSDHGVFNKIEEICRLLCQFGDLTILSDHLLDVLHSTPLYRKEVVLLLNEILSSDANNSPQTSHVVKNVLDVYLEPSTWYIPIASSDDEELTNVQLHSNLILACLLVEGIGKMAAALGRNFDKFLLRTLYVVLERAGSSHGLLAQAGMGATQQLATAGGHNSVTQLVCSNVDYFSYHVTMKLRRVEQNPGVLDVLNVVMKHSNLDVLPCMREIVNDVLLQSCDTFQDCSALAFLRVFHTFVGCIHQWLGSVPCTDTDKPGIAPKKLHSIDDVRKELLEYQQANQRIHEFLDSNLEENRDDKENDSSNEILTSEQNDEFEENAETKKKVPGHIQMTVAILTRCLHFLPSRNKQQKLVVLETLEAGIHVLANWEDELLPVVHLIWSPLVGRFIDVSEPLLINRSFHLLCTLANTARDFIHSRTLKQVLPSLLRFLKSAASDSKKKDAGSAYRHTQKYKLQYELLDKLGQLCVDIALQGKQLDEVLFTVIPYLSSLQPSPLQCCCVKLFKTVAAYEADAVWLKIYSLVEPCEVLPLSEHYLISGNKTDNKVHKNADAILQFLKDNGL